MVQDGLRKSYRVLRDRRHFQNVFVSEMKTLGFAV